MKRLWKRYRIAFKYTSFQQVFDELLLARAGEILEMIYWSHHSVHDILILTAAVDNKQMLEEPLLELKD